MLAHDIVHLAHKLGSVSCRAALVHLAVHRAYRVAAACQVFADLRPGYETVELEEHAAHDAEALLDLVGGAHSVGSVLDGIQLSEPLRGKQRLQLKALIAHKGGDLSRQLADALDELVLVDNGIVGAAAIIWVARIVGKGLPQRLHHAHVVHDEAVALALGDAVGARDRLHEAVRLHGFVEIHYRQRLDVEASEPHRAYEHDTEGVVGIFKLVVEVTLLHLASMGLDVEAPGAEAGNLVLLLAHHHGHLGRFHP